MRLILFFLILVVHSVSSTLVGREGYKLDNAAREEETKQLKKLFAEYTKFYEMPVGVEFHDITEEVLKSPYTKEAQKQSIQRLNRRILVFTYPSDGLKIKCLISFIPDSQDHPLLVFLRGGTETFGVINPGMDLMCFEQYTVIATMYRGGVSEGKDEYGGNDVNDVKNLMDFIPELESTLNLNLQNQKKYLLGGSRGGMQMFLALARFPELQGQFSKIVSLSGLLDMRECIASRPDLEVMFAHYFGLQKGINEDEWINRRDPILTVDRINAQLPILIIQGTGDNRTNLIEGYNMLAQLQMAGKNVTYWEVLGAKHCLRNITEKVDFIRSWLEE